MEPFPFGAAVGDGRVWTASGRSCSQRGLRFSDHIDIPGIKPANTHRRIRTRHGELLRGIRFYRRGDLAVEDCFQPLCGSDRRSCPVARAHSRFDTVRAEGVTARVVDVAQQ